MASKNIQLPELGEGVTEGELVRWLVKVGDTVSPDQAIAEMMTDKATVEVPSPVKGVVKELKGKTGDIIVVGQDMIIVDLVEGGAPAAKPAAATAPAAKTPAPVSSPAPMAAKSAAPAAASNPAPAASMSAGMDVYPPPAGQNVLATPATRRLAREMGVDINGVGGSGLAGRVTREDLLKSREGNGSSGAQAAKGSAPSAPKMQIPTRTLQATEGEERVALRGIRKKIAENMQHAKHIIPHFTIMDEANVTQLVKAREELKPFAESHGVKVTYLPFVIKALIATAREFTMFNASIDDAAEEIVYKKHFHIGFAADTPNGLLVPVIKHADQKTILQLSAEITDLANRARIGKLTLDEMKGATITITNIGSVGGTYATPIINHPEVAIIGMYKMTDKPVIKHTEEGMELDVIKVMNFTCTADHRLIDGAVAANFLKAFLKRIENPAVLMMDMI